MTLPSSGPISAQDVATEFGIGHPISFAIFYGKGGAPGSGPISLGDMRGRSAGPVFTPVPGSYSTDHDISFTINSGGVAVVWTWSVSVAWPGTGANIASGTSASILTLKAPSQATSDRVATYTVSANGQSWSIQIITPGTVSG